MFGYTINLALVNRHGNIYYGSIGGARAAEHLRGILGELSFTDVRAHPALSLFTDFDKGTLHTD